MKQKFLSKKFNFGSVAHTVLNATLPFVILVLVSRGLSEVAIVLVILSKWRAIAVTPRYWFANLRANAVDIIVGLSVVLMIHDANLAAEADQNFFFLELFWAAFYLLWLTVIKPKSSEIWVGIQALSGLTLGLSTIFLFADRYPDAVLVVLAWFVAAAAARHFLSSYEEPYISVVAVLWGMFVAQLAWLSARWTIVYEAFDVVRIPQITVIAAVIGYSAAELYHRYKVGDLTIARRNQILIFGAGITLLLTLFSDWSGDI